MQRTKTFFLLLLALLVLALAIYQSWQNHQPIDYGTSFSEEYIKANTKKSYYKNWHCTNFMGTTAQHCLTDPADNNVENDFALLDGKWNFIPSEIKNITPFINQPIYLFGVDLKTICYVKQVLPEYFYRDDIKTINVIYADNCSRMMIAGESGSPVFIKQKDKYYFIGIWSGGGYPDQEDYAIISLAKINSNLLKPDSLLVNSIKQAPAKTE